MTYDLLDSVTLASSASSVTFSSIIQSYGDLVLVIDAESSATAGVKIKYNNDSSNIYNFVTVGGGGSVGSTSQSNQNSFQYSAYFVSIRPGEPYLQIHQCFDYSSTNKHKSTLDRLNNASRGVESYAGRQASTNAVTSMEVFLSGANFLTGSTFSLYGIAK